MIVAITPTVRIRFDGLNYVIETRIVVGEGRGPRKAKAENIGTERWDGGLYYGDLRSAALALVERHLPLIADEPGSTMGLLTLVGRIDAAAKTVAEAVRAHAPRPTAQDFNNQHQTNEQTA